MSDLLGAATINRLVYLHNASYKNPARLVVRSREPIPGWLVYFWLDGVAVMLGEMKPDKATTAMLFKRLAGARELGVNEAIAHASGGALTAEQIHAADVVYFFAATRDGATRSLMWPCTNDKYVPASGDSGPPWALDDATGTPEKARAAKFAKRGIDYPPGYEPGGENPEDPDMPMSLLTDVSAERAKFGATLTNPQMGELLNAVAWKNRAAGWGLAQKPTGKHTRQPATGTRMSRDLLYHGPTQTLFDVLADVEGEARPVWNRVENDGLLPFLPPVQPAGVIEPGTPPVNPDPVDPAPPVDPTDPAARFSDADIRYIVRRAAELIG